MLYQTGHSTTIALTAPIADGSINVVDLALRDQTEDIRDDACATPSSRGTSDT